jgi:hypothetical protein
VLLRTNFSFAFRALISIRHFGTQSAGSEDYAQFKVGNIFLSLEFEIRTFVSYVIVHRQNPGGYALDRREHPFLLHI